MMKKAKKWKNNYKKRPKININKSKSAPTNIMSYCYEGPDRTPPIFKDLFNYLNSHEGPVRTPRKL